MVGGSLAMELGGEYAARSEPTLELDAPGPPLDEERERAAIPSSSSWLSTSAIDADREGLLL